MTPLAPKRIVGNDAFAGFAKRVLRAYARRIAEGDIDALADMLDLRRELEDCVAAAVRELRAEPNCYSWQDIADRLQITRQAAQARWPDSGGARRPGGQPGRLR